MDYNSVKIKEYKLFDEVSLPNLKRLNIIIGKNNCGKSSLIDVIAAAYDDGWYDKIKRELGGIVGSAIITEKMARDVFAGHHGIGRWNPTNYAKAVAGNEIFFSVSNKHDTINGSLNVSMLRSYNNQMINELEGYWEYGLNDVKTAINRTRFLRLGAERNIVPECVDQINELSVTGEGASNLVRRILTESNFDESIIEIKLLKALNLIFYPDGEFEAIRIQQISNKDGTWEIYLQEKGRQRIPLSKMGSGLKTIILVLLNLIVIPEISPKERYVFAFEEIENNLHPALQRRMFDFLYDYAVNHDTRIYLTTHSHVAINCFYDKEQASLYHIEKQGSNATVKRIESYIDKAEILSDLDVKASDLLQSNGIIWVEGPSDRIYIKRWLELFTDNRYKEGQHYQFLYYGGRLLSHYSALEETALDNMISILTTNRNAAIVLDSDKRKQRASINNTKARIIEEFNNLNMFHWITKGKEIENYIPIEAIRKLINDDAIKECGKYQLFPDFIEKHYKGFGGKKVAFANEIAPFLTMDNCKKVMDLQKMTVELYKHIELWNK